MSASFERQHRELSPEEQDIYEKLRFSEKIDGWLFLKEVVELYRLVITTTPRPAIFCEIGTWMGKSASILGKAALDRGDAIVYAVDPFTGEGDPASRKEYQRQRHLLHKTHIETCRENLLKAGVLSAVKIIPQESAIARSSFPSSFLDGLFIDGDHLYESVQNDVALWSSLLRTGAWIALHDVGAAHVDGPRRVMEEMKKDITQWVDWRIVGEMAVARRR